MTDQNLYNAFYKAFLASGREMGEDLKGLSGLYQNWRRAPVSLNQEVKKAA